LNPEIKVPFVNLGAQYKGMRNEIVEALDRISTSGQYILNQDVTQFEKDFAKYCGTEYAIAVGNGGDALYLTLLTLGLKPGDEVIVPANSFVASAWAVARAGGKNVFVDVRADYNLDPKLVEKAITPRTRAIMPVHLTGRPAPMDEINALAQARGLFVLEDAAQAVGAKYKGKRVGSLGHAAGFSLHPLKNLHVMGDGGVISTNDAKLRDQLLLWRNHGLKNRDECVFWGHNSRLDSFQAAVAGMKLRKLDQWNGRFREIGLRYNRELKGLVGVPEDQAHEESVFHRYIITTPRRDDLQAYLLSKGIETKVNYPIPLHLQVAAQADGPYKRGMFPVAEKLASEILSLPVYAELEESKVDLVIQEVKNFFKEGR
jgi:dTDP-4-amino-4,6-dideoxygalactose transaminase